MKKILLFCITTLILFNCKKELPIVTEEKASSIIEPYRAEKAMVVSARKEASDIGIEIMKQGGNAFDAAIAVNFALCVAYPYAGNIGGGGFMVCYKDGQVNSLDFREKAPLAAHRDMYLDDKGNPDPTKSQLGLLATGVPGTVDGMVTIHNQYGSLPWEVLIQPSIDLARKGVVITEKQAEKLNDQRETFKKVNKEPIVFVKEQPWKTGDILIQEQLAQTLEIIRDQKRAGFYQGKIADLLVKQMKQGGGLITHEDLNRYRSIWRTPVMGTYKDKTIVSMPPPSSGGITMMQLLKSIEPYAIENLKHNSSPMIQLLTEAERRAFADRAHWLGDPDFTTIPQDSLLSKTYNTQRMKDFSFTQATPSSKVSHGTFLLHESMETTHFSIMDEQGNAVALTTTLNGRYGNKVVAEGAGYFLNNEMDDFSAKPGTPNMFGLVGAEANAIVPEKRMLSSMTPTLVLNKENQVEMVVGSPGGSTIITSVLQTILNVYEYGMNMQEAVSVPRFHHQWLPDEIRLEPHSFHDSIKQTLQNKGYTLLEKDNIVVGKVDAILVTPEGLQGGADPRGDDTASGY